VSFGMGPLGGGPMILQHVVAKGFEIRAKRLFSSTRHRRFEVKGRSGRR
jgi:hypothetical protein